MVTTDQASRIGELLEEEGRAVAPVAELREAPPPGGIGLVHGSLSGGFSHAPSGLVVLTDRPFGPWALEAWPPLADAVLAAVNM